MMLLTRNNAKSIPTRFNEKNVYPAGTTSRSIPLSSEYWFGSRVRANPKQNEFWLSLLGRLINFEPEVTEDGHTTTDSCHLLRKLEEELLGIFFLPDNCGESSSNSNSNLSSSSSSQLKGHLNTLYSDLNELYHMMKEGGGLCSSSVPTPKQSTSGE